MNIVSQKVLIKSYFLFYIFSNMSKLHLNIWIDNLYILFTIKSVSYILKIGDKHLSMYKLGFSSQRCYLNVLYWENCLIFLKLNVFKCKRKRNKYMQFMIYILGDLIHLILTKQLFIHSVFTEHISCVNLCIAL